MERKKKIQIKIPSKLKRKGLEEKIDEEPEQSFPASDPPSYSQPGNDDIKDYE